MKKLNLGCGKDIRKDYLNVDIINNEGVDVICDFNRLLPFESNSFDEIICYDVLEHIKERNLIVKEIHRILKKGGIIKINVPYALSVNGFIDPTHINFFTYHTFEYYLKDGRNNWYFDFGFSKVRIKFVFLKKLFYNYLVSPIANSMPDIYEHTFLSRLFPASSLYIEAIK